LWPFLPGVLVTKAAIIFLVFVWVRGTLPRFRYDQLMSLGWKNLIPLALANMLITAIVILALNK
ncbi:MAG: NADH-quinone oxidoreductase subunit H, partial [Flavisolibacter sp.]|nr:NADH-quinone oxidoreductase subunit H [Flavisolibacter sp.]